MKRALAWTVILLLPWLRGNAQPNENAGYADRLWYSKPAINWNEALPIGNGRLGAMIYGRVNEELISLNEETLWSGGPRNWNNPAARKYLPLVRKEALAGNYKRADSLSHFMQGPYTESYMPMADLHLVYPGITEWKDYTRELDINTGMAISRFSANGVSYLRRQFASFPDQVIVYRDSATVTGSLDMTIGITSKLHYSVSVLSKNHIVLSGKCPSHVEPAYRWRIKDDVAVQYAPGGKGEGMTFVVDIYIKNEGGELRVDGKTIRVAHATAVTLFVSAATSYNGFDKSPALNGKDPEKLAARLLASATSRTYASLEKRHTNDFAYFFDRVHFNLGKSGNASLPTDERLRRMRDVVDPEMVALIAQYGRYLLISSSRPGGQPANLKGIWNDRLRPEYSSNWCVDHDAQMFYYAVETANLSELHGPFLQFIEDLSKNGRATASINYGMHGWCAHHNVDIWRSSAPVGDWGDGSPNWATWNMSGPWLCNHLFEHYLFNDDKAFLRNIAWPVMKGAAEFCLDWLIDDPVTGRLLSVPSVSPENTFILPNGDTANISVNTTSDIALMKELFTNCIRSAELLHTDSAFEGRLRLALAKLEPYRIGSKGQLLEWSEEWRSLDPAHRHLSHMYPVFPGSEISPLVDERLANAARSALTLREKTNCSWGFAWKAACWARLGEADSAWLTWNYQLQWVDPESTTSIDNYGLFPNLFNSDGRDVIMNGNGCATAVLVEMLMQSHAGAIDLLPALPTVFDHGAVSGLRARGGFEVAISWNANELTGATITSLLGNECRLRCRTAVRILEAGHDVAIINEGKSIISFKTSNGHRYQVIPVL